MAFPWLGRRLDGPFGVSMAWQWRFRVAGSPKAVALPGPGGRGITAPHCDWGHLGFKLAPRLHKGRHVPDIR